MKTIEGKLIAQGVKVGIVAARFNEFITSRLLSGAMDGLSRHGVKEDEVDLAWVPGAFEIPLAASKMSKGIASVSLQSGVPVMFGVLTTENIEQAIERAGTKAGNKGFDCAVSAIEMVNLLRAMD